jgi:hypothetical protein
MTAAASANPPLIVLHAGFHKTGTSSLQKALTLHRRALEPRFAVHLRASDRALAVAADAARDFSERQGPVRREALLTRLFTWAGGLQPEPGQGLLISAEDLSGHMPGHKGVATYAAAPAILRLTIDALTARFGAGVDIRLLFTTRGTEDWLRSIHWQLARHPTIEIFADHFARTHAAAADFEAVIQAVRAELPGVRIETAALEVQMHRRLGPVEALYDLAAIEDSFRATLRKVGIENQSPPYDLSGAFVALNRANIPRDSLRRLKLALLASAELDRDPGE